MISTEPELNTRNLTPLRSGASRKQGGRSRAKNLAAANRKATAEKVVSADGNKNLPFYLLICGRILVSFSNPC